MTIFYAVFDTNVLVSALMSKRADSPTVLLLDYVLDGRIVLLYNEDIIREYEEVLRRSKFDFDGNLIPINRNYDALIFEVISDKNIVSIIRQITII